MNPAILAHNHYWLRRAHCPLTLLPSGFTGNHQGLAAVDLEIAEGRIARIQPTGSPLPETVPQLDLDGRMVLPCFVDSHTHLDKGHIWERSPNPDGTFAEALTATRKDAAQYWQREDVYRRMEFGLRCSESHGTKAIRTHIDCIHGQGQISLPVAAQLREEWRDRLTLQIVSLVPLDEFLTPQGVAIADQIAELGAVLGGVAYMNPDLETQLDAVFTLAQERGIEQLDFHVDESGDPEAIALRAVAEAALRHNFTGSILCGHCCSLAVQAPVEVAKTLALVKQAGIAIVSLPMCNLFLQDRRTNHTTPRWRGVTLAHEIRNHGIPLAFASDNCRDPFYGFGDHDMLEVFRESVRIAHLDYPWGDWVATVTDVPAQMLGLGGNGLEFGQMADFVIFSGRCYSELLARSQHDRWVIRNGKWCDRPLPDYRELDDLVEVGSGEWEVGSGK
ncbi:cytosine deaminase [Spirulina sp. CCNP1310]|uniref:cytosine deaminase n=1 Tax=Spirulina sp. CCNP1310 TaxID=3110249 RepID=UPI002B1E9883|nr:cytosine deaminase [Spirulina sp. CCNP1310]MEA5420180.1 cytosine deaminase [Spirulina sp. CCNP1310]